MFKNIAHGIFLVFLAILCWARYNRPQRRVYTIWVIPAFRGPISEPTKAQTVAPAHAEATATRTHTEMATPTRTRTSSPNGTHRPSWSAPSDGTRFAGAQATAKSTATMDRPEWIDIPTLAGTPTPTPSQLGSIWIRRTPNQEIGTIYPPIIDRCTPAVTRTQRSSPPPIKNRRNRLPWGAWMIGAIIGGLLLLSMALFGLYENQEQKTNAARSNAAYWQDRYTETRNQANALAQTQHQLCPQLSETQDLAFRDIILMSNCSIYPAELSNRDGTIVYRLNRSLHPNQDDPRGNFKLNSRWAFFFRHYMLVGLDTDTNSNISAYPLNIGMFNEEGQETKTDYGWFVQIR